MANKKLPFDAMAAPYFGEGFNPPSINFIVYAIINLFLYYSFFSLLEGCKYKIAQKAVGVVALFGRYTLYTFMYHLLVRDVLKKLIPDIAATPAVIRILIFVPIITVPPLVVMLLKWCKSRMKTENQERLDYL